MTTSAPTDAPFDPKALRRNRPRVRSEAAIVAEALKMINQLPAGRARKVHGGPYSQIGEPDIDACVAGRAVKLEAKRPGEKPDGHQVGVMSAWRKAGALVGWFTDKRHVAQILDHANDPTFSPDPATPGCSCGQHGGGE